MAIAQSLEGVLMPGKVVSGHAKVEDDCRACHIPFRKDAQDRQCAECHKEVAADVAAKRGFHGRQKPAPCRTCHTDHKGRDAKIAPVDERKFDHAQTDFALRGAHPKVECRKCHEPAKKYREAPGTCIGCHVRDDTHKGALGKACADCHTESDWKETRFDHAKTRFSLTGKHSDVKCADCHRNNVYKDTPSTCVGCHRKDDKHQGRFADQAGRFGDRCETCHGAADWKKVTFDHDSDTRYPLRGLHRRVNKCESCHLPQQRAQTSCVSCHRKDDKHQGTLGNACADCHVERGWKETKFDHSKTKFPLLGKHENAECNACHKTRCSTTCRSPASAAIARMTPTRAPLARSAQTATTSATGRNRSSTTSARAFR